MRVVHIRRRGRCGINRLIQRLARIVLVPVALGVLAACGANNAASPTPRPPTPIPPTPTPRSTALPTLAQPPALLGGAERPLTIAFALPDGSLPSASERSALAQAVADALQPLSATLNLATDIEVQVVPMDDSAALQALCSGAPVTAWVSGFTYAAAARACEVEPLLALVHEDNAGRAIGTAYDLLTLRDVSAIADLAGQVACRVEGQADTWVVTALMLQAEGLDPLVDMPRSMTYPDEEAALQALLAEECAALALPIGALDALLDPLPVRDEDPADRLHALVAGGDTALPDRASDRPVPYPAYVLPFGLWVAAPESALPASDLRPVRQELEAAVRAYFDEQPDALTEWFDSVAVVDVDRAGLRALIDWLEDAHWDMAYRP